MNYHEPKVFLFCLGGTGARVLKSLVFLLASGANLKASKIIPILIDPDNANGDVQHTLEILKNYQAIRHQLEFQNNGFFKTEIQMLSSLEASEHRDDQSPEIAKSFRYEFGGAPDRDFSQLIGYESLSPINRAMANALFSDENFEMKPSQGIKSNSHLGSVVLNQFIHSQVFKYFASKVEWNDRVFIVSSIFGGTGAAGFPMLVNSIRDANYHISNYDTLRRAPIGAITLMPYFSVEPSVIDLIDKNIFDTHTKAVLDYHSDSLNINKSLNVRYYIDDLATMDYKPFDKNVNQITNAHAIEMFSALSIFDFMDIPMMDLTCIDGRPVKPIFKEYGIIGDDLLMTLQNLGPTSKNIVFGPLTQYALAVNYWNNRLMQAVKNSENWTRNKTTPIKDDFLKTDFYLHHLVRFNSSFRDWVIEMANNTCALQTFNIDTPLLHNFINGFISKKKSFLGGELLNDFGYDEYNHQLNMEGAKLSIEGLEKRFMAIFFKATEKIVQDKFNNIL